ncbi:MAG: hypothetical protein IKD04_01825 [Clostridia bacterium]|nr:hypothetical protein [Clostridia bacterium]
MDCFCGLSFEKGIITVLGAEKSSTFVVALTDYLKAYGTVSVAQRISDAEATTDYMVFAPDNNDGKYFVAHSEKEAEAFKEAKCVIGVINIAVMEKKISEAVKGYQYLCDIADVDCDELVYPYAIAKTVSEREKYNLLYIDGVNSESKRFLARELAKLLRYGVGIRLINTDNGDIEILCK